MRNLKSLLMGSAAVACVSVVGGTAQAQSVAFGAGATFPQIAYRQLMDCLYDQAQGSTGKPGPLAKAAKCASFNQSGFHGLILYAPTGSGNGKAVLQSNNPTTIGTPGSSVPYTDSLYGYTATANYDGVQFIGSDDVMTASDVSAWNAAGNPAKFGNIIQIPALIGPVGIGFNGKDENGTNLNIQNATPTGGSSGLNLSRKAVCGLFSGHITKWNNSILTALNANVALGTGKITVVHRQDGSGTTFLLTNALVEQCRYEFGPNNESDSTVVSYAFPWTPRAGVVDTVCPANPLVPQGSNTVNWPDQYTTNQCGAANPTPTGSTFLNASGTGNLVNLVTSTNGSIGYASSDFWLPVRTGGLKAANVQSQWDITANTGKFQPPTYQAAQIAMTAAVPQFADQATISNPLAWSLQGVVPNPAIPGSYPISGFTWIDMYQCYQPHPFTNPLVWLNTWLNYLYGSTNAYDILHDNGFAEVPFAWNVQVSTLLSNNATGPRFVNDSSSPCNGKVGAY